MNSILLDKICDHFEWYYENGYITVRDGNAAIRHQDHYVVTASGVNKKALQYNDFVAVNDKCEIIATKRPGNKASIETGAHIAALSQSGKKASVHVHSPNTVALAALFEHKGGFMPSESHLVQVLNSKWPELFRYTKVGYIVPFLQPGSQKLHDCIEHGLGYWTDEPIYGTPEGAEKEEIIGSQEVKKWNDIVIMQRHGVLAIGNSLDECMEHIVRLEHISGILLKIVTASGGDLESIL